MIQPETCANCGKPLSLWLDKCRSCGAPSYIARPLVGANAPLTLVRTYRGQQAQAMRAFQSDAANLAAQGYAPVAQSWAGGQWGASAFIIALLLCLFLIGILVFLYLLIVKPAGTLTVTYRREAVAQVA